MIEERKNKMEVELQSAEKEEEDLQQEILEKQNELWVCYFI